MLVALLTACATRPEPQPRPVVEVLPPQPLSIPTTVPACDCDAISIRDSNDFDRGVRALAARNYEQARLFFERHRKSEAPEARREADVGMAFVTLLSDNTVVTEQTDAEVDDRAAVMVLALAAVATLERRIDTLDALNEALSKDLRKREEALKRLRDLTLGQQEESR